MINNILYEYIYNLKNKGKILIFSFGHLYVLFTFVLIELELASIVLRIFLGILTQIIEAFIETKDEWINLKLL